MITSEDFLHIKEGMRKLYDSICSPVYCRCLNQQVHFNAKGFHHLLYNGLGKARSLDESVARLMLVPFIFPVMRLAQDYSYEKRYVHKDRRKDSPDVMVEMWAIEAIVGKSRSKVRVIIKRTNQGQFIFWSVMRVR
jgi:hypothetical protein